MEIKNKEMLTDIKKLYDEVKRLEEEIKTLEIKKEELLRQLEEENENKN